MPQTPPYSLRLAQQRDAVAAARRRGQLRIPSSNPPLLPQPFFRGAVAQNDEPI